MKSNVIFIIIASIAVAVGITAVLVLASNQSHSQVSTVTENMIENNITSQSPVQDLKKFNSVDELQKFLLESQVRTAQYNGLGYGSQGMNKQLMLGPAGALTPMPPPSVPSTQGAAPEAGTATSSNAQYSTTNIQVAGIDEPDFLKNDNKYAYILSQDKLTIIDAYPGDTAKIVSKIGLDVNGANLQNMFLNKDRLVIFYNDNKERYSIPQYDYIPSPVYTPVTHAVIIDVSDKENPKILKNYETTGYYTGARMIGDYVYLISNSYVDYVHPMPPILRESSGVAITPDVYYFDNQEPNYNFNTITTFNIFSDEINSKTFMMGATGTLYVSNNAIYLTYQKYHPYYYDQSYDESRFFKTVVPLLPADVQSQIKSIDSSNLDLSQKWAQISDLLQNTYNKMSENDKNVLFDKIQKAITEYNINLQQDYRKTVIQKFAIDNGTITYAAKGEVPGYLLNQYSMDEYGKRLRVATTSEYFTSNGATTTNNVYVLDDSLNTVGSLEKIAQDESIYSARFMGDKLYLVTYHRIDPFFVIDLSSDAPRVLGALKIPGYSSYLHPYDETHIIGIGKETKQNQYGGLEPVGVKISLFDVSDMTNPVTVDTFLIGGLGTDSEVLSDPKAFLFDKEKNVLSIPVFQQYYGRPIPLESSDKNGIGTTAPSVNEGKPVIISPPYQPNNWRGFYVFGIDPAKGFSLKGIVEHYNGTVYDYTFASRSFYIDDSLYTLTSGFMKINDLSNLTSEINTIKLEDSGQIIKYPKLTGNMGS
ncbi:MAG TPA: beta-propeller domain-containing protein [Nitrosopumilaceae archaeon]|nr:beta-propeller domain-containing protein [Nitrosopumilaceae archaeon]